jgi:hypothetical protein
MKTEALYNSRITKNYVEYLKTHHPAVDVRALLEYAGMTPYQVEDAGHWFTQNQVDRFHEAITKAIPNPDISREAGRFSALSAAAGDVQQYALSFVNPSIAYRMLGRIFTRASRSCIVSTRSLGKQQIEIIVKIRPGVTEKPYQCDNRLGTLEAIGRLFTDKFAQIDHETCIHKGGDVCRYVVSWEISASHLWKQIRNASLLVGRPWRGPFLLHGQNGVGRIHAVRHHRRLSPVIGPGKGGKTGGRDGPSQKGRTDRRADGPDQYELQQCTPGE